MKLYVFKCTRLQRYPIENCVQNLNVTLQFLQKCSYYIIRICSRVLTLFHHVHKKGLASSSLVLNKLLFYNSTQTMMRLVRGVLNLKSRDNTVLHSSKNVVT